MISEEDKATSYRVLLNRLYMDGELPERSSVEYTKRELYQAVAGILLRHIGSDAFYAACELLCSTHDTDAARD